MMKVRSALFALTARASLLAFPSALALSPAVFAQMHRGQAIESMKLLTSKVGWAATRYRIYWTTNGSTSWRDITPPIPDDKRDRHGIRHPEEVACVFFLDAHSGWGLFARQNSPEPQFELASTRNTGASWSIFDIRIPHLNAKDVHLYTQARIAFADSLHGWMNITAESAAAFRLRVLLVTSDGGKSWQRAHNSAGVSGAIVLVTSKEGWLAGGPDYTQLWVTRDGANTWHHVSLQAPAEIRPAIDPTYDRPTFTHSRHGFEPVTFSGGPGTKSAAVLFATDDGGNTWRPDTILSNLEPSTMGEIIASVVVNQTWIIQTSDASPAFIRLRQGSRERSNRAVDLSTPEATPLSFVSDTRGWVLSGGRILSIDGAAAAVKSVETGDRR